MRILRLPLAVFCLWILHLSSSSAQNRESLAFSPEMRIEVTNGWSGDR